jgi:hypothetical protein
MSKILQLPAARELLIGLKVFALSIPYLCVAACDHGSHSAAPSQLSYSTPTTATVTSPMSPLAPKVTGTVTSYSVSPSLPAGLSFDVPTGMISGTPTQSTPQTRYTVTASNVSGQTTFVLLLTVNPPPTTDLSMATVVTVESTTSAAASKAIVNVESALTIGTPGAIVNIPVADSIHDSFVFAVDASDDIMLASSVSSGSTVLTSESTATVLVRLTFGPVPDGLTADGINAAIEATAGYPALVSAITQALGGGASPALSSSVVNAVSVVIGELGSQLLATLSQTTSRKSVKDQVVTPTVSLPLPYKIVQFPLNLPGVTLDNNFLQAGVVNLVNSTLMDFNAISSADNANVELPRTTLVPVLLGQISSLVGPPAEHVADEGGRGFNITINQSNASTLANYKDVENQVVLAVLPSFATEGCATSIEEALISSEKLDELAASPSIDSFLAVLGTFSAVDLSSTLKNCIVEPLTAKEASLATSKFLGAVGKYASGLQFFSAIVDGVSLGSKIAAIRIYQDQSFVVGVCETAGTRFGWNIDNCAASFKIAPDPAYLIPGAVFTPTITADDATPAKTGVPNGLTFAPTDSTFVAIVTTSSQVQAVALGGPVTVTVTDPSTNAMGHYSVTVVQPVISPATATIDPGGFATLSLAGPSGDSPLVSTGVTIIWTASNPGIVDMQTSVTPSNLTYSSATSTVTVKGLLSGTTTITATDTATGDVVATATVTVRPPCDATGQWVVDDSNPNPSPSDNYFTWTLNTDGSGQFYEMVNENSPSTTCTAPIGWSFTGGSLSAGITDGTCFNFHTVMTITAITGARCTAASGTWFQGASIGTALNSGTWTWHKP